MNALSIRAALAIAGLYGCFLLFAQFAYVELLRGWGLTRAGENTALGLMAVCGISAGFLAARRRCGPGGVRAALLGAAFLAVVAPLAQNKTALWVIAAGTGVSLGLATVWMAAMLPRWCNVAWVGLGTGIGYACCNLPPVFLASPDVQAWVAAGFAAVGALAVPSGERGRIDWIAPSVSSSAVAMIAVFTALVWLDSAAFFIIQHSAELKDGTWGRPDLWRNVASHFGAAGAAGWMLHRGRFPLVCVAAWGLLAVAALAVNDATTRPVAGWLYPVAVSMYSTALVAWPAWFSGARGEGEAAWRAAWVFAVAGWFGSANGIAMAGALKQVPEVFIAVSGLVVVSVLWIRRAGMHAVVTTSAVVAVAWLFPRNRQSIAGSDAESSSGRSVYLAEGCIHCHTRYTRPGTMDELLWGRTEEVSTVTRGKPVLIGNRRHGPDLSRIGARRSEAWLREHFLAPRSLVPDSVMPSYAYLFEDERGEALITYLKLSGIDTISERMRTSAGWEPQAGAAPMDGARWFGRHCAACHGADGRGGGEFASRFQRPPANLVEGPFIWTAGDRSDLQLRISRVIKFGIPGTDMPGHEVFRDGRVLALADEVIRLRRESGRGNR